MVLDYVAKEVAKLYGLGEDVVVGEARAVAEILREEKRKLLRLKVEENRLVSFIRRQYDRETSEKIKRHLGRFLSELVYGK